MTDSDFKLIDNIKCYAPELSVSNDGFSADSFEQLYKHEASNFWFCTRNRAIHFLVKLFTDGTGQFLEVGCGTGFVLQYLQRHTNLSLVGSEIYLEGLKFAKRRLPDIDFVQLDATRLPYDDKFDFVGAFDVLEHIAEDELVMRNIFRSLKPDGVFFISVPQYQWMWSYLDDVAYHKRRYVRKDLINKLETAGFKVDYVTSFVFTLFPFMVISRLLKRHKHSTPPNEKEKSAELNLSPWMNKVFEFALRLDLCLIKRKVSLPFGGSLMAVARKPTPYRVDI